VTLQTDNQHHMNVLDRSGHTKIGWDPSNADEVAFARDVFEEKTAAGFRAFKVRGGQQSTRMETFDPQAREMMLVPQLRGG
jgi:hypothetical protein